MSDLEQGISVTGTGRAAQAPDTFVAVLAAEASSAVPAEAMERAGAAITLIRQVAVERGAEPTTGQLTLRQGYDREGQPSGVVAEIVLTLRSADPAAGGDLVAACIEAGGAEARLQNTSFEHADPAALLAAARDAAFRDAETRAHQLAGLARRGLGRVLDVVEGAAAWAPVATLKSRAAFDAVPVDPGQLDASVTLTVRWAWAEAQ